MERALAVVDGDEADKELAREAGALAHGVDAELVLLHVTTEDEFFEREETLQDITEFASNYGVTQAKDGAEQFARDIGREVLEGRDVTFEAAGRIGDDVDEVLRAAEELGCDHVFVRGQQRSPSGKAIFGDRAQQIALKFDGPVTLLTG